MEAQTSIRPLAPSGLDAPPLGERLAATPRLACQALARAINAADLAAALACFTPGACLAMPDGNSAHGEMAIGACLGDLIARGARVRIETRGVLVAEDIALAHERWSFSGQDTALTAPAGSAPTMVLRRVGEEWKVAIAAPWGAPATEPLRAIPMTSS